MPHPSIHFLSIPKAAPMLGLRPHGLWRRVRAGKIPLTGSAKIAIADLEAHHGSPFTPEAIEAASKAKAFLTTKKAARGKSSRRREARARLPHCDY